MNLKEFIKEEIRQLIKEADLTVQDGELTKVPEESESSDEDHSSNDKLAMIRKFPPLQNVLIRLLSKSYDHFIKDIQILAPKPTTFSVQLRNNLYFQIIYSGKDFSVKISGKKYWLSNVGESEQAVQAIANLLSLSPKVPEVTPSENKDISKTYPNSGGSIESPGGAMSSDIPPSPTEDAGLTPEEIEASLNAIPEPGTAETPPNAAQEETEDEKKLITKQNNS